MGAIGTHAVVIGGSVGGVLAARVLADRFDRVTVLDRDELPAEAVERKGAPQALHAHGLLVRGREIVEELFPGITEEMLADGAMLGDMQNQAKLFSEGRSLAAAPSDIIVLAASRPLLETHLRRRLAALPNVTIRDRTEVVGLTATEDNARVTGVRVLPVGGAEEQTLPADVVVDASGRSNRSITWLGELGYPAPPEEVIKIGIVYATQEWRRATDDDLLTIAITISEEVPRGAAAIAAEGGRWVCTLVGTPKAQPSAEAEDFVEFAAGVKIEAFTELLKASEPLGSVVRMRMPTSTWRRFDKATRLPERYVAFADAICYLNPVYGQGMTVAAIEALALRGCLDKGLDRIGPRFFAASKPTVALAWQLSSGGDLRFSWVEGARSTSARIVNRYVGRLILTATHDPAVAYRFLRVTNMVDKPTHLFSPAVLRRVMRRRNRSSAPV